ncbi:MAG: alanine--tRNA ligase [Christensenellales bacterium]
MKNYTSKELRDAWLNFYKSKGHIDIGAVSLIGDGTTGVMFNVAGMQPLMPYLLGEKHPAGKRLCNVQGCVRTIDIDSVGDESHCTFFEMMGNWSLGDYFKKEKTAWTFELLTQVFGLDKDKICCTVFAGNESAPRDNETAELLINLGIRPENIYYLGKEDNWWELAGTTGTPCGPDNEWFYPLTDKKCGDNCDINCSCKRYVEIGNDVYMQYEKLENGYRPLANKNVDTGFGFERMLMFLNGLKDVYKTDLFVKVIEYIEKSINVKYGDNADTTKSIRIICDHMRTALMLIGDRNGIVPSNVGAGYILRRLLRRAIRHARKINLDTTELANVAKIYIEEVYDKAYPFLNEKKDYILSEILKEVDKFNKTIETGSKEFDKLIAGIEKKIAFLKSNNTDYLPTKNDKMISGKSAFRLYDTFGFPIEMTKEMAEEFGYKVDEDGFKKAFEEHQELARTTSAGAFKSGLGGNGEMETKYHTATHLLNAALKRVIGEKSHQMGSNITSERLRFDFACDHKMTTEELNATAELVNLWISEGLDVTCEEMSKQKAVEIGAEHQFLDRYPDIVTVYSIGDVSKEICTGPHVKNTSELGKFVIKKEEASSSGVRRIKAILN